MFGKKSKADREHDALEDQAIEMITDLTKLLTEGPEKLADLYTELLQLNANNPEALESLKTLTQAFITKIPDITHVISNSTKVMETYLAYKTSKRQEQSTNSLLEQNKNLIKENRRLAWATVVIATTNIVLSILTVLRFYT